MKITARNQLKGTVVSVERGPVTSLVKVDIGGQHVTASVTSEAIDDLGITEGREVMAVFKASSVMLGME
ncbi:MAG: TOBE domain-containing protein [Actinomycetota bacterium]|nr:TOBE domain-containing protein [Actinomycetota bacterium]MDZ4180892.1 TOBE domain-containing protein [Coriobacteriia bacterium]